MENHRAASAEQLALAGKQGVFGGPVVFDQDIAETIELVQFEPLPGIEAQELERGAIGLQPVQACPFTGRVNLNSAVGARQSSRKLLMLNQCLCLENSTMANPFGEAL